LLFAAVALGAVCSPAFSGFEHIQQSIFPGFS